MAKAKGAALNLSAAELAELNESLPANGPIHEELLDQPLFRD